MRSLVRLGVPLMLAALGCHDSTAPRAVKRQVPIFLIDVPARAGPGDTIRISFVDGAVPCDTGVVVEARTIRTGLRFTAYEFPTGVICPYMIPVLRPWRYEVVPPHPVPFTAIFSQPEGADSVRVIAP